MNSMPLQSSSCLSLGLYLSNLLSSSFRMLSFISLNSSSDSQLIRDQVQRDLLLVSHSNTIGLTINRPMHGMIFQPLSKDIIVFILLSSLSLFQSLLEHILGHHLTGLIVIYPALRRNRLNETIITDLSFIVTPLLVYIVGSIDKQAVRRETILYLIERSKGSAPMALAIYNLENSHR